MIGSAVAGVLATVADLLVALLALAVGGLGVRLRRLEQRLIAIEDDLELEHVNRLRDK